MDVHYSGTVAAVRKSFMENPASRFSLAVLPWRSRPLDWNAARCDGSSGN
ncbi:MAG: hypothetical protein U1D30_07205 [Planctomycetota bacterium]